MIPCVENNCALLTQNTLKECAMAPQIELRRCFQRSEANPIKQNTGCSQTKRQKMKRESLTAYQVSNCFFFTRVMLLKLYECWEEMTIATFPVQGSRGIYTHLSSDTWRKCFSRETNHHWLPTQEQKDRRWLHIRVLSTQPRLQPWINVRGGCPQGIWGERPTNEWVIDPTKHLHYIPTVEQHEHLSSLPWHSQESIPPLRDKWAYLTYIWKRIWGSTCQSAPSQSLVRQRNKSSWKVFLRTWWWRRWVVSTDLWRGKCA